ncbi:hypothetical protein [Streptomyces sp. AS02]|uniref:hypothetical protein n=1 Tax=Streptomyces sp. AS02 TaxID=2938946 RepID=UPI00202075B5|nr:hypothetical protein [Streptomyces sp. AS02]MCL8014612.1 hypothetical protein [Streptomyces sp. AS02]
MLTPGPGLRGRCDERVSAAVRSPAAADLVVVAGSTFEATHSGVLELFLDQFAIGEGLWDVVAVSLMLGAGPARPTRSYPTCCSSRSWWSSARSLRRRGCI